MTQAQGLEIRTGCRLHFGLMELCRQQPRCYSGLGMMLQSPSLRLRLEKNSAAGKSDELPKSLEHRQRLQQVIERRQRLGERGPMPARIVLKEILSLHHGLGAGTQLACAAAAGLALFTQWQLTNAGPCDWQPCAEYLFADLNDVDDGDQQYLLAKFSGRGTRSAIGLRGFLSGGLVLDHGMDARDNRLGHDPGRRANDAGAMQRLFHTDNHPVPDRWRVVLIVPQQSAPISGTVEAGLLESLAEHPNVRCHEMLDVAHQIWSLLPNCPALEDFGGLMDEYLRLAGLLFSPLQGGPFISASVQDAVLQARATGLQAVGQSSWGPTVFGFAESHESALWAMQTLQRKYSERECEIVLSRPDNQGARFRLDGCSQNQPGL